MVTRSVLPRPCSSPVLERAYAGCQVPVGALGGAVSKPVWKSRLSWYLVATDGKMIPPAAHRLMSKRAGATVAERGTGHAVCASKPQAVAALSSRLRRK
ncbi:MAG: alpha/beta fold hydrolase [Variovorax sp.]